MSLTKKKTAKKATIKKDTKAERLYELLRPAISKQSYRRPGSVWGRLLAKMDEIMGK